MKVDDALLSLVQVHKLMQIHNSMDNRGNQWDSLEIFGNRWRSIEILGHPWEFMESVEAHAHLGYPRGAKIGLRQSMDYR